jgi:hypothetical protein
MAGVATAAGGGRRRVDQEINMIPFIDLLMVTVSFLLITAVWTSLARVDAHAALPGSGKSPPKEEVVPSTLHVKISASHVFTLQWQAGTKYVDVASGDMTAVGGRYPALEAAVARAYAAGLGTEHLHAEAPNPAILHVENGLHVERIVAVLDAVNATHGAKSAAFQVALSID